MTGSHLGDLNSIGGLDQVIVDTMEPGVSTDQSAQAHNDLRGIELHQANAVLIDKIHDTLEASAREEYSVIFVMKDFLVSKPPPWMIPRNVRVPATSTKKSHTAQHPQFEALQDRMKTEYVREVEKYKLLHKLTDAQVQRQIGPRNQVNRRIEQLVLTSPSMPIRDALTFSFTERALMGDKNIQRVRLQ